MAGALLAVVAFVVALGVAAAVVVTALDRLQPDAPLVARCAATLDDTDWTLSPDQAQHAALFAAMAERRHLPARAVTIAIATGMQESKLENIDYGDRDSIGLFQQRPSQGWGTVEEIMDPVYSTGKFYDGLVKVKGYEDLEVTVAAQAVQRSGFPDAYAQHETRARAWASALTGHSPETLTCTLPEPAEPGSPDAAVERLERDFGGLAHEQVPATDDEPASLVVHTGTLGDTPERQAWAVAAWAVATAQVLGTTSVDVADRTWARDSAEWTSADAPLATGDVRLTFAP